MALVVKVLTTTTQALAQGKRGWLRTLQVSKGNTAGACRGVLKTGGTGGTIQWQIEATAANESSPSVLFEPPLPFADGIHVTVTTAGSGDAVQLTYEDS